MPTEQPQNTAVISLSSLLGAWQSDIVLLHGDMWVEVARIAILQSAFDSMACVNSAKAGQRGLKTADSGKLESGVLSRKNRRNTSLPQQGKQPAATE